jgi:hypothetical protein
MFFGYVGKSEVNMVDTIGKKYVENLHTLLKTRNGLCQYNDEVSLLEDGAGRTGLNF